MSKLTVRQIFELAGYPVPQGTTAIVWSYVNQAFACLTDEKAGDSSLGYYYFGDLDKYSESLGNRRIGLGFGWILNPLSEAVDNEFDVEFDLQNVAPVTPRNVLPQIVLDRLAQADTTDLQITNHCPNCEATAKKLDEARELLRAVCNPTITELIDTVSPDLDERLTKWSEENGQ